MKKPLKITIIALAVILALIILLIGTIALLNNIGKSQFHKNDANITNSNVVENEEGILYKGKIQTMLRYCIILAYRR